MSIAKHSHSLLRNIYFTLLGIILTGIIIGGCFLFYLTITLPNVGELKDIRLQVPLRIYTADNKLISEFGEKRRSPIALAQVPTQLIQAILATEDQRFYEHAGVDLIGMMRAAKAVILTGKKVEGASTITMQVARNFFLTRRKTYIRKIREILLAIRIDHTLSKNKVLELYLNKIYLGQRSYGVAAAADTYYGKPLSQLTLPQLAMIAGLPQAPSRDNPITNPKGALERRDHVLERMFEMGAINQQTYQQAIQTPVTASYHGQQIKIYAPYVAELVRDWMLSRYGIGIYDQGYKVYTTINAKLQLDANFTLQQGLLAYNKRHGYLGPEQYLGTNFNKLEWKDKLAKIPTMNGLLPAAIVKVQNMQLTAMLTTGQTIPVTINWPNLNWQFRVGDVIRVIAQNKQWQLTQVPQVNGALVALNPQNGAILALNGGFSFIRNNFNCVTQALRQAGSSFKPFIYSAALAKGYTLASIINDAPIVTADYGENSLWRPQNDTHQFYGPTRLRIGLIKSRNLVSIRLLQAIGIPYTIDYLQRFGFAKQQLPATLSLALGTATITPLQLATGYAVFANGGYKIPPYIISTIKDEVGQTIYQYQPPVPQLVLTSQNTYLITDAMKDVIRHGTGRQARILHRSDLAGKTGTTNQQNDAWFSGFNRDLVTTVWVGFNNPHSLGEYGAKAALPIWINFMKVALQGMPENSMPQPANISVVRIDPNTGLRAYPGQKNAIFEMFRNQYIPKTTAQPPVTNTQEGATANTDELF